LRARLGAYLHSGMTVESPIASYGTDLIGPQKVLGHMPTGLKFDVTEAL